MESTNGTAGFPSRTRRKTKTGCRTCKLRKVKCDEQKPSCHRCTSTGRTCEGYGIWGGGSQNRMTQSRDESVSTAKRQIPLPNRTPLHITSSLGSTSKSSVTVPISRTLSNYSGSVCEGFLLRWYRERTVKKLPGLFPSKFWDLLLLQAGCSEPAVQYATLALTSAHKSPGRVTKAGGGQLPPEERFALKVYSRAIQSLGSGHQSGDPVASRESLSVTLVTCILFMCLEVVQRRYRTAMRHLMNGLRLIDSDKQARGYNTGCVLDDTDDLIAQMLLKLWLQVAMLGQSLLRPDAIVPRSQYRKAELGGNFRTAAEARRHLDILVTRAQLLQSPNTLLQSEFDICAEQATVQSGLELWLHTFNASFDDLQPDSSSVYRRSACLILRMYHTMASIQTYTASPSISQNGHDEMRFDRHLHLFQSIITYAVQAQKLMHATHPNKAQFTDPRRQDCVIDAGWVPPLYYTALKCRHHDTRQQAINLIDSTIHREGFWDPRIVTGVVKEVIRIEGGSDGSEIPAQRRLQEVRIILPDEGQNDRVRFYGRKMQESGSWEVIYREYDDGCGRWISGVH